MGPEEWRRQNSIAGERAADTGITCTAGDSTEENIINIEIQKQLTKQSSYEHVYKIIMC